MEASTCRTRLFRWGSWKVSPSLAAGASLFSADQFPTSTFKEARSEVKANFPGEAAHWAQKAHDFLLTDRVEEALQYLALERNRFQMAEFPKSPTRHLYGILKDDLTGGHTIPLGQVFLSNGSFKTYDDDPKAHISEWVAKTHEKIIPKSDDPLQEYSETRTMTDLSGNPIPISKLMIEARRHKAEDGSAGVSFYSKALGRETPRLALNISVERAKRALSESNESKRFQEFALSAYAFFTAMPYRRGSAAIGRVFYTALAQRAFGKSVTLNADIDLVAHIYNERDFVAWLEKEFSFQGLLAQP